MVDTYIHPQLLLLGNLVYLQNDRRYDYIGELFASLVPVNEGPLDLTRRELSALIYLGLARHFVLYIDYTVTTALPQNKACTGEVLSSVYLKSETETTTQLVVEYYRTDGRRATPFIEENHGSMPLATFLEFSKRKWIKEI